MITVTEIKEKALQKYPAVITALLRGDESMFPLVIPANKKLDGSRFSDWAAALRPLAATQKSVIGKGFSIDWRDTKKRQQVPQRIYFETAGDFLFVTGKEQEFNTLVAACGQLVTAFPQLSSWAIANHSSLLKFVGSWAGILAVCRYFTEHAPPHPFYLRELPVPVHTKFIEDHAGIVRTVLDQLLPMAWINPSAAALPERYGLKTPDPLLRIRVLDEALVMHLGYPECALPLEEAKALNWQPRQVFIVENQACYLSFPSVPGGVAVFGKGFAARLAVNMPWMESAQLFGWFDLDAEGFQILHMSRRHYPHLRSLLMDAETLEQFRAFTVPNPGKSTKMLPYLTTEEQAVHSHLCTAALRLEQERITQDWLVGRLSLASQ